MTRKKYIKVLMSLGVQRNEAQRLAEYQLQQHTRTDDPIPMEHTHGGDADAPDDL